ncbi:MAG TPA: hypothetical protein VFH73_18025 [Polyangia bacterium]|nr:hypothetical protein [Polyangia bacterium]
MSITAEPWQPILDAFTTLRTGWPSSDWTWDHRLKCVVSSFTADLVPATRAPLEAVVPADWTSSTIPTASDAVRALADRCGGLRPSQRLLTGEPVAGLIPYALWWPWGDGSMVSVRLGIANSDRPKELFPQLRAVFGIA